MYLSCLPSIALAPDWHSMVGKIIDYNNFHPIIRFFNLENIMIFTKRKRTNWQLFGTKHC